MASNLLPQSGFKLVTHALSGDMEKARRTSRLNIIYKSFLRTESSTHRGGDACQGMLHSEVPPPPHSPSSKSFDLLRKDCRQPIDLKIVPTEIFFLWRIRGRMSRPFNPLPWIMIAIYLIRLISEMTGVPDPGGKCSD